MLTWKQLKPCCVKISQLAIREGDVKAASRELLDSTSLLYAILSEQTAQDPLVLDEKLAEYVFFPLHHVFRQMGQYPILLVENCVKCLGILIAHGWRTKLRAQLVQQILSLLVYIIDHVPKSGSSREVPEETVLETLRAQAALFNTAAQSSAAASGLASQEMVPVLGHAITVMLDRAASGTNPEVQREALRSLQGVYSALKEPEALASFLPGIVSSLSRMLSTPNRYKSMVLVTCLETVQRVLITVLGDIRTRSILAQQHEQGPDDEEKKSKILSLSWLKATTSQVKLALSTVVRLRTHSAPQVQEALERLCVSLLDECHSTLSGCTEMLVETAIILDNETDAAASMQTCLGHLASIFPELGEVIKGIVYNWMSSLPRLMQASDEDVKQMAVLSLSKGMRLLRSLGLESETLEESATSALKDSIIAIVQSSPQSATPSTHVKLLHEPASEASPDKQQFEPILLARQSQKGLRRELVALLDKVGSATQKAKMAENLMQTVRESLGVDQIAAMWLCFELLKSSHASSAETEAFFDLSAFAGSTLDDAETVFDDLYGFSVQVLDCHTEAGGADWRLEALAMEVTAYAAHRSGQEFRPELIDVLFPVAAFLGSDKPNLQQHAVATLNSIAMSAQYPSVSDLIVDNVDYMVNSVALRLNSLDVSPASMQVLLMMVRLAGARLIPFLDDVVDSIFAALDNYHGYTAFVDSLFAVLKEVVDQASRTDQRLLADSERAIVDHRKRPPPEQGLDSLIDFLDKRAERRARDAAEDARGEVIESHPKVPWGSLSKTEDEDAEDQGGVPPSEEKPRSSPTYQLLLRIATLTQHYLTSPSPKLRRSLLELLATASPMLAGDEDSFLPLVNATWPVVVGRLYDGESFVTIEACHALSSLCKASGDFLSTRFKDEWKDGLHDWCSRAKQRASSAGAARRPRGHGDEGGSILGGGGDILVPTRSGDGQGGIVPSRAMRGGASGGLGQHASPVRVWEAVVKMLTALASYVHMDDYMFDDVVDLLSDALERSPEVREALEAINADAVWLARYERGRIEPLPTPVLEGVEFAEMVRLPRR